MLERKVRANPEKAISIEIVEPPTEKQLRKMEEDRVKLEDLLPQTQPETGSEQQGSLPITPMPNQQVIAPPMPQVGALNQGLTPAESSYLSEDEKQMRLRQRGLS